MTTVQTRYAGNSALQEEQWTLALAEARKVVAYLKPGKGTVWDGIIAGPTRRAARRKSATVHVWTAFFSTGEFANILSSLDIAYTQLPALPN